MSIDVALPQTTVPAADIPLVDLRRQYESVADEIQVAFDRIFSSMRLFLGPNVLGFESDYASYLGVAEAIGVSDGTTALQLALLACGVGPGDEVITVSNTFFATVEAIALVGATPVFVDVDPETLTMDIAQVERAITPRTRALLPVHLYGRMVDMPAIMALARRHGLRVIEDACQAHGARQNGRAAGTIGDVGCFSFYYSKNLGAYGEAGGVVTNDLEMAEHLRMLRDHGSSQRYKHDVLGTNARLDEMQAAVLRIKLRHLDRWNAARIDHARYYNALLADTPLRLPSVPGPEHVFHLYVVQTEERDALQAHLERNGIHTGIHYPIPCHLQPACAPYAGVSLPVTETSADRILSLPMYPELEDEQIERVAAVVRAFFN